MTTEAATVAIVADVGGPAFHVGDEAMLEANLRLLRQHAPQAIPRVIGRDAGGLSPGDRALFISGGGNLSSSWPDLLGQRIELIGQALRGGLPVVAGGQTLGPELGEAEPALAAALRGVAQLGLRELPSLALAVRLGVPAQQCVYQVDDAYGLPGEAPQSSERPPLPSRPFLLVTLDGGLHADSLRSLAQQLARFVNESGLSLVFLPHVGPLGEVGEDDGRVGRTLALLLGAQSIESVVLPVPRAAVAVWLTQQAAMVLSSRYHPLVFATAAGVPALGLHSDSYTRIKLQGALAQVGLADWTLSLEIGEDGNLLAALRRLWRQREPLRHQMLGARPAIEAREAARWQALVQRLGLARDGGDRQSPDLSAGELVGEALSALARERQNADAEVSRLRRMLGGVERSLGLVRHQAGAPSVPAKRPSPSATLSPDQWAAFDREGFLRLGQVLAPDQVEALRQRADDLAQGRLRNPQVQMQLDTGGDYDSLPGAVGSFVAGTTLYRKIQGLETDELYARLLRHPLFLEICARQYGAHAPVSIFRAMVMNKPAGQGTVLPWHQDGGDVWALDRDPLVTAWVALDTATEANGCMEIVPGSHRLGLLSQQGSTLAAADAARHCPPDKVRPLEVEAGHAVVFHNWLIHRSGTNPTPAPRRAFTACFMDGRTRSVLTGGHFPMLVGELPEGTYPFIQQLQRDSLILRASMDEATTYARALEAERVRLNDERRDIERYALSLQAEIEKLRAAPTDTPHPP